jgi:hypothetical protein
MTDYGLWDRLKIKEVIENLEQGIIKKEKELVGDTTHFHAYSGFETVTYIDEKGKQQRKSQSKTTKNCRCEDKDNCAHPWELVVRLIEHVVDEWGSSVNVDIGRF